MSTVQVADLKVPYSPHYSLNASLSIGLIGFGYVQRRDVNATRTTYKPYSEASHVSLKAKTGL